MIGCALQVHHALGPGFVEAIYGNALAIELRQRGVPFDRELPIRILYSGCDIGLHRLDFLIDQVVIVELKAVQALAIPHLAVLKSYLRAANLRHGLIFNFSTPKLEIRRIAVHSVEPHVP